MHQGPRVGSSRMNIHGVAKESWSAGCASQPSQAHDPLTHLSPGQVGDCDALVP